MWSPSASTRRLWFWARGWRAAASRCMGGFIWAELADRMPTAGGQYAYLRDAYHPLVSFLYGWVLLLVIQTGGMAAVTVTFSRYFLELTGWHAGEWQIALVALTVLTVINCMGVRAGGTVQSGLMVLKIAAIALLVFAGAFLVHAHVTLETCSGPAGLWRIVLLLWCGHGPRGLCLWRMAHSNFCLGGNKRPAS